MVEAFTGLVILTVVGALGGFVSSWLAFNAMGERFNKNKHANALVIGIFTGLGAGVAAATIPQLTAMDYGSFYVLVILTFLGAGGVDRLRASGTQMAKEKNGGSSNNGTTSPKT